MRSISAIPTCLAILSLLSAAARAQGGDDCASATSIAGTGTFAVSTVGATAGGNPTPCDALGRDVWFAWTATLSGTVIVSLCGGTPGDAALAVWDGSPFCPGVLLACNDDTCSTQPQLSITVTAGTTYYLQISDKGLPEFSGTFTISTGVDTDGDGTPDDQDGCPLDPLKIAPGACGCGYPDVDANMDGIMDCLVDVSPIPRCGYDDGIGNQAVGLGIDGTACWMQRFGGPGQTTTVHSVATAWGLAINPGAAPANGSFAKVAVWNDPDGDGTPNDAQLIALQDALVSDAGQSTLIEVQLAVPVTLSGYFFIGASTPQTSAQAPAPLDGASGPSLGRAWFAGNAAGAFDHANLQSNTHPPQDVDTLGAPGVWLLRPDCGLPPGDCRTLVGFFDRNFEDQEWTTEPFIAPAFSIQVTTGGNPNAWRSVSLSGVVSGAFLWLAGTTYSPAADGALQSIDWSVDTTSDPFPVLFGLALRQGGNVFATSPLDSTTAGVWTSTVRTGFVAANFSPVSGGTLDFSCGAPPIEIGVFTGTVNGAVNVGIDNFRVDVHGQSCAAPDCCEEAAVDANGDPILPAGMPETPTVEDVEEDRGDVEDLYGSMAGDTVDWVQDIPCSTLGGTVPISASAPDLLGQLAAIGINTNLSLQGIQDQIIEWEQAIASSDLGLHVDMLPSATPIQSAPAWTAPAVPHIPDPNECYAFEGRDIVFVHDLRFEHILDSQLASCPANDTWHQPGTFPGSVQNPEYYGNGYFKQSAELAWADHIDKFLTQNPQSFGKRPYKNRYLIVCYSSADRVDRAAHAILTQISDAMKYGTGVVDPVNGDTSKFGTPSFVVVSQGLGSLVTDIALSASTQYSGALGLQAEFIARHCKAHVALHGAFKGTRYVTAMLAAWGYVVVNNPGLAAAICGGIATFQTLAEVLGLGCAPSTLAACFIAGPVVQRSALLDMVPLIVEAKWSPYLDTVPVPTVTVSGGHPSMLSPLKHVLAPGFDDGWINVESQCAKRNLVLLWPSLLEPAHGSVLGIPIPNLPPAIYWRMFDMGTARTYPLRATSLYVDQVVDRAVTPAIIHLNHVASPGTPYLSPLGMIQSRLAPYENPYTTPGGFATLHRHPQHYNFIHSAADHFTGTSGRPGGYNGQNYGPTALGLEPNREETITIVDPAMYQPYNFSGFAGDDSPITRTEDLPAIHETVKGRRIRVPTLQGLKIVWKWKWVWKRTYHRPVDFEAKHQCDYVYECLLRSRPCNDTGEAFCFCDHGNGPCFPSVPDSEFGRGCRNSLPGNPGGLLGATGIADRSDDAAGTNPVVLHATDITSSSCLFFQGTSKLNGGNGVLFGDGLRCIGNTLRLGTLTAFAGAADFPAPGDPPLSTIGQIPLAGGTYHYQVWYRNSALFCTSAAFNLTNAYTILWAP